MVYNRPALSLLPLVLFFAVFFFLGVFSPSPEGAISPTVAILPAIILAFLLDKRVFFQRNVDIFTKGVGNPNILTMCFVFLLAGAFTSVTQSVGATDAAVYFALDFIPPSFLLPGVFLVSSFIGVAMGSGMGTIAAIAPIAISLCSATSISLDICMGAVVGGAMFGDNLSIISDTTIAAVQTQGCEMKDKFRMNFKIALPAMIATVVVLYFAGSGVNVPHIKEYDLFKVLPYLLVLFLSLWGLHVFLILLIGIVFAGIIGMVTVDGYSVFTYSRAIFDGYGALYEIMILSMLIGGLSAIIKQQGGMRLIIKAIEAATSKLNHQSKDPKYPELAIGTLSSIADICTANNTVSILLVSEAAKTIAEDYDISPKRTASILDIFACVFQGILPYSAQILLAASLAGIYPLSIVGSVHYCYFLGAVALFSIFTGYARDK